MQDSREQIALAWQSLRQGDREEAVRRCQKILNDAPNTPAALQLAATLAMQDGDSTGAINQLQRAVELAPADPGCKLSLGRALAELGRTAEAIAVFQDLASSHPDVPEAHAGLGVVLQMAQQPAEAIEAYGRALSIRPDDPQALANLANCYKLERRYEECIQTYERCVTASPNAAAPRVQLARALLERGRVAESADAYHAAARLTPDDPAALRPLVFTAIRAGQRELAAWASERFLKLSPDSMGAAVDASNTHLALGQPEQALEHAERVLSKAPGHRVGLSNKSIAIHELGRTSESSWLMGLDRLVWTGVLYPPDGFDSMASFNHALLAHIREHPSLEFDNSSLSCHHGATSSELLVEPKGPVAALERSIRKAAKRHAASLADCADHPFVDSQPAALKMGAWATILESQGHQDSHIHASAWLSGVYYVDIPDSVRPDDPGQAGWLELGRPPRYFDCKRPPALRTICPEAGRLVLFPSYVYHRTIPFDDAHTRVSVAFDLYPQNAEQASGN